jgi:Right handed beta helix region
MHRTRMLSNSFDTHAMAADIAFLGNDASGGTNVGISVRGQRCAVVGNTVRDCGMGITVGRDASGSVVSGNDVRRINASHAIQVSGAEDVAIRDNRVAFAKAAGLNVINGEGDPPDPFDVKRFSIVAGIVAANVVVQGNRFYGAPAGATFAERGAARGLMLSAVRVRSAAVTDVQLMGNLVDGVFKGTGPGDGRALFLPENEDVDTPTVNANNVVINIPTA